MKHIKNVIIFLTGVAVGGFASYLYLNNKLRKEYEAKTAATVEEMALYFKEEQKEEINKIKKEEEFKSYSRLADIYAMDERTESDESWPEEPDWASFDYGPTERTDAQIEHSTPYIITEEEHFETFPRFDTIECYWRPWLGELTDENGEIIDEIDETVGCDNLKKLESNEYGEVFVRNERLTTDYQIYLEVPD